MYSPGSPEEVIRCYQDLVYRVAFAYCKNPADAEDITQEVFVRYLKHRKGFNDEEHLKSWLVRVTANASKSLLRSAWFRKTAPLSGHENLHAEFESAQNGVYTAVMALPEKYRAVVLLYYFEGYAAGEIAKMLRRTETAVQTQLQRARAMLKKKLKEDWENE